MGVFWKTNHGNILVDKTTKNIPRHSRFIKFWFFDLKTDIPKTLTIVTTNPKLTSKRLLGLALFNELSNKKSMEIKLNFHRFFY